MPRSGGAIHAAILPGSTTFFISECTKARSASDKAYVQSLMQRVIEPGKMAGWIAPPERGINNLPVQYEYVKLH